MVGKRIMTRELKDKEGKPCGLCGREVKPRTTNVGGKEVEFQPGRCKKCKGKRLGNPKEAGGRKSSCSRTAHKI